MATGFEDYVTLMTSSPATALSRARSHCAELMKLQGVRTNDMGVSYDPSTLKDAIDQTRADILTLEQAANLRGLPFCQPFRRVS